ncbi:hypothetical protein Vafri_15860 [Volvox africanus]|uniref:Uncharacterized protein n=1 Tax=Volvox africanus TaxID=51714 RepID=A0A8J4F898_9CHLO|nr:hypothetical protein Vafri_15860 [Volvox africanus]
MNPTLSPATLYLGYQHRLLRVHGLGGARTSATWVPPPGIHIHPLLFLVVIVCGILGGHRQLIGALHGRGLRLVIQLHALIRLPVLAAVLRALVGVVSLL